MNTIDAIINDETRAANQRYLELAQSAEAAGRETEGLHLRLLFAKAELVRIREQAGFERERRAA